MIARGLIFAAALLASAGTAFAQAPVERGKYLVNTILTCQNCHTPKGERGAPVFERDLSSGLSWDEPPFKVTASNITQDKDTGIGVLERRRHQEGAAEGRAAERRAARRDHAVGLLRDPHPRRPQRDRRLPQDREAGEAGDADADLPHRAAAPHPAGRREAVHRRRHGRQGEEGLLSRDHRPLHGVPHADGRRAGATSRRPTARAGSNSPGRGASRCRATSPRTRKKASARGATTRSSARSPRACSKDGSRLKPPMGYEFYANMTEADLDAIVAYLRTVPAKE